VDKPTTCCGYLLGAPRISARRRKQSERSGGEGRAGARPWGFRGFLGERDKPTGLDEDRKKEARGSPVISRGSTTLHQTTSRRPSEANLAALTEKYTVYSVLTKNNKTLVVPGGMPRRTGTRSVAPPPWTGRCSPHTAGAGGDRRRGDPEEPPRTQPGEERKEVRSRGACAHRGPRHPGGLGPRGTRRADRRPRRCA
jgi:hypothetical protein